MFDHLKEYSIYIKPGFTDMRKRADSLSLLVRSEMGMDPMEKSIYIFCGRDRKRVTAIVWDSNGWLEFSKEAQEAQPHPSCQCRCLHRRQDHRCPRHQDRGRS